VIKNLVSFGCSWTYGDELIDPALEGKVESFHWENDSYRESHSYPGLVAKHYGWTHEDIAWNGASLQSMLWNFNYWLDHSTPEHIAESIVLIGLTDESRMSWYNTNFKESRRTEQHEAHRYVHSVWINNDFDIKGEEERMQHWRELHKLHYTLCDDQDWRNTNFNTIIRAFDGMAARHNLPMIQFKVLTKQHKLKVPTLLEGSSALEILVIRDKPRRDPLFKSGQHPNEKGHEVLADYLIGKINAAKLQDILNRK